MILYSILGGFLGRLGGKAGLNTKFRDFGVPLYFVLVLPTAPKWILILSGAFLFALLTEGYGENSLIYKLCGKLTFAALGGIYSLASLPYSIHAHSYAAQGIFTLAAAASTWAAHEYRFILSPYFLGDAADFEEFFRYFSLIALAGGIYGF